jgi:hypothetical protein
VENCSLEDWLRRTPGGKVYYPPKQKVAVNKKGKAPRPPLAEVTFRGFDWNKRYKPSEHTAKDKTALAEATRLLATYSADCTTKTWMPILKPDESALDLNVKGYTSYDKSDHNGKALATCVVSASPAQVMGYFADRRNLSNLDNTDVVQSTYVPLPLPSFYQSSPCTGTRPPSSCSRSLRGSPPSTTENLSTGACSLETTTSRRTPMFATRSRTSGGPSARTRAL